MESDHTIPYILADVPTSQAIILYCKTLEHVSKFQNQLTTEECEALLKKWPKAFIVSLIKALDTQFAPKKYKSVYLTVLNWGETHLSKLLNLQKLLDLPGHHDVHVMD